MRGMEAEAGTGAGVAAGAGAAGDGDGALIGRDITTPITPGITTLITGITPVTGILTHIDTTPTRVAAGRPGSLSLMDARIQY